MSCLFEMNWSLGFTVLLLTFGFPFISAGPIWSKGLAETQGFKDLLKTIGTSLCKAAYDDSNPNAIAETMRRWGEVDEVQIETVKDFLNRFRSNLCDYITDDTTSGSLEEKLSAQAMITPFSPRQQWNTWPSLGTSQKINAEMQGRRFSKLFNTVGSALCKAAYDNNPNALAEAFPLMNEAEVQGVKDFLKRFGSILCDSITGDNGGPNEQSFDQSKRFPWTGQELSKAEMQGFMDVAKKVGSAFCKAAYEGKNPRAVVESLGVTDEMEIQQLTDFLKRFGANLCDYVTEDSKIVANQGRVVDWATERETSAEEQGFFRKIGSALCGAAYNKNPAAAAQLFGLTDEAEVQKFTDFLKRFGSNLCDSITDDSGRRIAIRPAVAEQSVLPKSWSGYAQKQGFSKFAKKIGSALCGAAYNPSAVAENAIAQGLVDEADAQQFKDFVKRFGAHLCDYITEDNGKVEVTKQDLAQELMAALE